MTDTDQSQSGDQEREDPVQQKETAEQEERRVLMTRARMMGLSISNNIGLETLRKKIQDKMDGVVDSNENPAPPPLEDPIVLKEKKVSARQHIKNEAMKLIRVQITNLDPKKKDLQGEIFTVGNSVIGTVRKFVPYGEVTENGYHIPNIIYNMLKRKKFLNIRTRRGPKGEQIVEQNWAQEFSITVLPPLTEKELKELATAQLAAGSIG